MTNNIYRFQSVLIKGSHNNSWTYIDVPAEIAVHLHKTGRVFICGKVDKGSFRTTFNKKGNGEGFFYVNQPLLKEISKTAGDTVSIELWEDEEPFSLWDDDNEEPFTKETFISALKDLHIGEWRRRYSTKRFGYMVLDGTQWELEFEYSNGHKPVRFDGDNSYPYNFDKFQILFGIDVTEEDDEDE